MKRSRFIHLTFLLIVFSVLIMQPVSSQSVTNLALKATVTTSYVSPWETLSAVNNGIDPRNSADKNGGAYGNWNGEGEYSRYQWVQYDWQQAHRLNSTAVYWWDDNQGIDQPTDAYVEYWNGASWIRAGNAGVALNRYNELNLNILTNKIRITMKSLLATGILEWKVMGVESSPCNPSVINPFVRVNGKEPVAADYAVVRVGDDVAFEPQSDTAGVWNWSGPDGFTAAGRQLALTDVTVGQSGSYSATFMNACGAFSTQVFILTVLQSEPGSAYEWPQYQPTLNYNFRDEYPSIKEPTHDLGDCEQVVGSISQGWWTFRWGPSANPLVTPAAVHPMLERMNGDFAYFRDSLGWPPDKRAKRGYRSAIYLYGSGLCTDNASNTALGGWQSAITYRGESWPMVLASYYPVYSFDPACPYNDREFQMGAMVHEGIHSVLADLPGCRNAGWFHEGGNTWLQQEADSRRTGNYSDMGFLNVAAFIAPFMPVECYSGWLQDGSFGGPSAEGVNRFQGGKQLCTYRNLLGGNQYGNTFPVFLSQTLGPGSIPWIWRYCPSRVLEGMADSLGDSQTRRLITEYRAKQALLDLKEWTGAMKKLMNGSFKATIQAEWQPSWLSPEKWTATPYVQISDDGTGVWVPESRTTPGWSGANQIPLLVEGDEVTIEFRPLAPNMSCQLCYRTAEGQTVYGQPVLSGECSLKLGLKPANGVVFAVICNTDYRYLGEETRTAHFDYRLRLTEGVVRPANIHVPWFNWDRKLTDITGIGTDFRDDELPALSVYPNPVRGTGEELTIVVRNLPETGGQIEIRDLHGKLHYTGPARPLVQMAPGTSLSPGVYFITLRTAHGLTHCRLAVM